LEEKEFDYINVIPLVDIMLVLLTIVLTTATFIAQGKIAVNLPSAKSAEKLRKEFKSVEITIKPPRTIFLDGVKVSLEELEEKLKGYPRDVRISIMADRTVKVATFIQVLDVLNELNFRNINVVVNKEENEI